MWIEKDLRTDVNDRINFVQFDEGQNMADVIGAKNI